MGLAHPNCLVPCAHLPHCTVRWSAAEVDFPGSGLWRGRTTDVFGEPFDIIGARYAVNCPAEPTTPIPDASNVCVVRQDCQGSKSLRSFCYALLPTKLDYDQTATNLQKRGIIVAS